MGVLVTQNLLYLIQILIHFPYHPDEPYARDLQAQGACALGFFIIERVVSHKIKNDGPCSI